MKKRLLTVASATVLTLSMGLSAMADVVSADVDYGTAGQATDNSTAWNSAANGQFAIEDGQTITFTFDSQTADTANAVFGWVAEVTDGTSYFTVTQGGTAWFAPAGCEWATAYTEGTASYVVEKSWADEDAATYAEASANLKVELVVTRSGANLIFDSKATDANGTEYTQTITGVLPAAPEGTLNVQVGSDHGKMTLYTAKYGTAGEVEEVTTKEKITFKPNLDASAGVASTTSEPEDEGSNTTMIIVIVAVVLVLAVAVGVVVATKKKKN